MSLIVDLEERLAQYGQHASAVQGDVIHRFTELLRASGDPFSRTNWSGHVTASAIVTNEQRDQILLLKHRKLGIWLQPGGHVEAHDTTILEAALREAEEETGLRTRPLLDGRIADLDIHEIPARPDAPAHLHYDVRFIVEADELATMAISAESMEMRWYSLNEIARFPLHSTQQRLSMVLAELTRESRRRIPLFKWWRRDTP